jgi:hypothetical protein
MELNKELGRGNPNMGGSIKNKIVNPDLLEERKNLSFDAEEMEEFFMGKEWIDRVLPYLDDIHDHPEMKSDFSWYGMTRE